MNTSTFCTRLFDSSTGAVGLLFHQAFVLTPHFFANRPRSEARLANECDTARRDACRTGGGRENRTDQTRRLPTPLTFCRGCTSLQSSRSYSSRYLVRIDRIAVLRANPNQFYEEVVRDLSTSLDSWIASWHYPCAACACAISPNWGSSDDCGWLCTIS